jgi:glycosyltransferase involved in cell wall biosynthesis
VKPARSKHSVLFLQSQKFFGSDSEMHANIIRHLDRDVWDVHVALGDPVPSDGPQRAYPQVHNMKDISIRQTDFGPQRTEVGRWFDPRTWLRFARAGIDMVGLASYIRRNRIEIIHGTEKPRDAFFAVLLSKVTRAKSLVHVHIKWDTWLSRQVQWALRNADAVVGVSSFVRDVAVRDGKVPAERSYVILNGIEASRWHPELDGAEIRREFGVSDDEILLGIFSRMSIFKGHLDLANALGKVVKSNDNFRVLVVGTDDPRSAPGRRPLSLELRELAEELHIADKFIYTGWRTDMEQLMASVDMYTMPTFEEPCAVTFLEAMSMAKPIVALQSGGTPEIVPDEEVGLLAPVGDIDGLATRLLRLIDDADLRRAMGAAGREHVTKVRTAEQMARDADAIYRSVLGVS